MARRVPVTIALVDRAADQDAPAVILRRRDAAPHDVILLRRGSATGEQLAVAIQTLLLARDAAGDTATTNATVRPRPGRAPSAWMGAERGRAERVVARLRGAAPVFVAGVGTVPAVEIYLPSKAMREAQRTRRHAAP
jgi:hypothetical protein